MNSNLIEVTLTPEQLKQLTDEHKLTVSTSRGIFVTLRINKEDDGRRATTKQVHKLLIDSLHDAQAHCSCGNWVYTSTGKMDRKRAHSEFRQHVNYRKGL